MGPALALRTVRSSSALPALAAGAALFLPCLVLSGWAFHLTWLTTVGIASMKPNTAVGLFLLGLALWQLAVRPGGRAALWTGRAAASAVLVLGLVTMAEYLSGWDPGIDRLLFPAPAPTYSTPYVGRMGFNTALALVLLAAALLALGGGRHRRLAETGAALACLLALAALLGYVYGVEPLTRVTVAATQMALHTALVVLLLGAAVLRAVPEGWLSRILTGDSPGSVQSRRFLPLIFCFVIALGWLRLEGQRAGAYGTELGLSIMVLACLVVITATFLWSSSLVDRLDAARRKEEDSRLMAEVRFAAMQEASRLKSKFLADMSHELRTPMNAIIGFSELLYDGRVAPGSAGSQDYLATVLGSARYLLRLIDDLLDLAKVESGNLAFSPEPLDLDKIAQEVHHLLLPLSTKKGIHLEADIAPALDDLVLDAGRLKQVLYNLLSNALKFTPPQGRVTLRARPEGADFFRLEVEDTGIGIREEDLSRLFQEFQQVHQKDVTTEPGTGLGLALTKRIVEAQGGRVGVSSAPGKGSIFFALLPRQAVA
jgi:signal transduction histidine kinase